MLERVAVAGTDRLADLAVHQPGERAGLDANGLGPERGDDLGGPGEQEVADEDREGVVPAGVGAQGPAPLVGLVHHVVVVQRGQVGQLDHDGRGNHSRGGRVAELGGERDEQRTEALAAGTKQVRGRLGHEGLVAVRGVGQLPLDLGDTRDDPRLEGRVGHRDGQGRHGG